MYIVYPLAGILFNSSATDVTQYSRYSQHPIPTLFMEGNKTFFQTCIFRLGLDLLVPRMRCTKSNISILRIKIEGYKITY